MKKSVLALVVLLVLASSFVLGGNHDFGRGSGSDDGLDIGSIVSDILDVGRLDFLLGNSADSQVVGLVRILLAVLVFVICYFGLSVVPGLTGSRSTVITIAVILAILVSVFFPKDVLLLWATTYATIFAFVIIFGPIIGLTALLLFSPTPTGRWAFIKLLCVGALWWLVAHIGTWANTLGSTVDLSSAFVSV